MDTLWTLPELVSEVATRIAALPAPKNGQVRAIPDERTVRYYVTLGLLDRPSAMRGRTALYGRKHVAQVVAIKRLQTMGRSLSELQALWPTLDDRTLARMSGVELPAARPPGRAEFWKREPVPHEVGPGASAMSSAFPEDMIMTPSIPRVGSSEPSAIPKGLTRAPGGPGTWTSTTPVAPVAPGGPGTQASAPVAPRGPDATPSAPVRPSGPAVTPEPSATPIAPIAPVLGVVVPAGPASVPGGLELRIELAPEVVLSIAVAGERVAISPADVRAIRAAAAPLLAELASRRLASHSSGEEP